MSGLQSFPVLASIIEERFSCRSFDSTRPVDVALIHSVINAARIAPSAVNRQPWQFLIVQEESGRTIVTEAYNRDWLKSAPTYIIAFGDHSQAWRRQCDGKIHIDIDVAIAVEHICLAAASLGLGTCWVCNFNPEVIRKAYNVPEHLEPIAIIPIGYPADGCTKPTKNRKSIEEIIKWEKL